MIPMLNGMRREIIDLRSDTVTRPTRGMRAAIATAQVGDDFYREDYEVLALQEQTAALFGHEDALFMPSGSMGNQIAMQLLVPPGGELLCDADAYIVSYQNGSSAAIGGISTRTWPTHDGNIDIDTIAGLIHADGYFAVPTRAIAVENTHNRGGGTIVPLSTLRQLRELADNAELTLHCDGARIWHAHVAEQVPLIEYGRLFDTISVCLSKGLGAPVGSLLVSSAEKIERARSMRRQLGGGMRQVGMLAAAGRYALTHHIGRLMNDHIRARHLACALADFGIVTLAQVQTNMVLIDLAKTGLEGAEFAAAVADHGLLVVPVGPSTVRAVTHLDVDEVAIESAIEIIAETIGAS